MFRGIEVEAIVAQGHKCANVNATVVGSISNPGKEYLIFSFSSL